MRTKRLLLSSAATLLAASGARAADAVVVAEPEPAEYVKICDVYGAGYFYIPGTETCLHIGGDVRYGVGFGEAGNGATTKSRLGTKKDKDGKETTEKRDNDIFKHSGRLALKASTAQETELGTLKSYAQVNFNSDESVELNSAWAQIGGLRFGRSDSAFTSFTGYSGGVIQDSYVPYGDFGTNAVSYTFDTAEGFSAMVSLEQGSGAYHTPYKKTITTPAKDGKAAVTKTTWVQPKEATTFDQSMDSYVPHVVIGARYTPGWGGISGVFAYNTPWREYSGKVRLDVNPTEQISLFVMGGYGSTDHLYTNFYKPWNGNWAVWTGGSIKLSEKVAINTQMSYDESKTIGTAINVEYEPVPGFKVIPELDYTTGGKVDVNKDGEIAIGEAKSSLGGLISLRREF